MSEIPDISYFIYGTYHTDKLPASTQERRRWECLGCKSRIWILERRITDGKAEGKRSKKSKTHLSQPVFSW